MANIFSNMGNKNKTTIRYYDTCARMSKTKKSGNGNCWHYLKTQDFLYTAPQSIK